MTDAEILAGIAAVAREHLEWTGPVRPEMRLVEELRLDSIKLLTLAIELENRFRVRLDEEDERAIVTVGDLVAAIGWWLEDRGPGPVARGPENDRGPWPVARGPEDDRGPGPGARGPEGDDPEGNR